MIKKWKAGVASEDWQVAICLHDIEQANTVLQTLAYMLVDVGNTSPDECAKALSPFTGEELIKGILAYRQSARQAVENGKALPLT